METGSTVKTRHSLTSFLLKLVPRLGLATVAVALFSLNDTLAQPASLGVSSGGIQSSIVGPQINIWTDPLDNMEPVVAYSSIHGQYLVVGVTRQGPYTIDIVAQRVDSHGNLVGSSFTVATAAGEMRDSPVVVYNPAHDEYLVVYVNWYDPTTTPSNIFAKRVRWDGGWISSELPIATAVDDQVSPAVAYNSINDEYLVVYTNQWAGGLLDIYAQRVRGSDGALVDWRTVASGSGTARSIPSVAYSAAANSGTGGYLITYTCQNTSTYAKDIRGKVAHGDLTDLFLNPEIPLCTSAYDQWDSAVASGRQEYLAIWWENVPGGHQLRGRRVGYDGTPLGNSAGFGLSVMYGSFTPGRPSLAHGEGFGYLAAWRHEVSGPSTYDIHGIHVMDGQDSPPGSQFAIDDSTSAEYDPSVACAPSGDCLVVYSWWNTDNYDIRGRFVKPHHVYLPLVLRNW